jgi:hypothetical protein
MFWIKSVLLGGCLFVGGLASSRSTSAQPTSAHKACPAVDRSGARQVIRALSQDRLAWFRRKYSLTSVSPKHLRLLIDARNSDVCSRLNAFYANGMYSKPPWNHSYYTADGYYFASFIDKTNPKTGIPRMAHFAVFDGSMRLIARLSPK